MLLLFSWNFINNNQILLVPFDATDDAFQCLSESYSEICQISKMKRKNWKTESRELFRKNSILDVWQSSEYASTYLKK